MAIDAGDNVYVADNQNARVQKFTKVGIHLGSWPDPIGIGTYGIACSPAGTVLVGNYYAGPISVFSADGTLLGFLGAGGSGPGEFFRPHGMWFDNLGNIYVADKSNHRCQRLDPGGTSLDVWGGPGSGPGQFPFVTDILVAPDGRIYTTDWLNHRVQVFVFDDGVQAQPATWGRIKASYR